MKIKERYLDEILKSDNPCKDIIKPLVLDNYNLSCSKIPCDKCRLLQSIRLEEEYEEPEVDWTEVLVDTPIYVRNSDKEEWIKAHFAKYEDGKVFAYYEGSTSWTSNYCMSWKYAKLAEDDYEIT